MMDDIVRCRDVLRHAPHHHLRNWFFHYMFKGKTFSRGMAEAFDSVNFKTPCQTQTETRSIARAERLGLIKVDRVETRPTWNGKTETYQIYKYTGPTAPY
jgi:hypothetical protein